MKEIKGQKNSEANIDLTEEATELTVSFKVRTTNIESLKTIKKILEELGEEGMVLNGRSKT